MEALSTDLSAGLRVGAESGQTDTAGGPSSDTTGVPSSDTTGVPSSDTAADSSPAGEHRLDQYKNAARLSDSQHARRQELLRRQKRGRDGRLDRLRAIAADDADTGDGDLEQMDTAAIPAAFRYKKKEYYQSQYANQLMFSEWMEETPPDLHSDWLLKICPPGKRCLVVTRRGSTRSYSARGALLRSFPSHLPCGKRGSLGQRPTVLDCIWEEAAATFHVLDLICWNGHLVVECETEFRFSWLQSKLSETPELGVASRCSPYRFVAIRHAGCSPADLLEATSAAGAGADGALFFHRAAHYRPGDSPLVLWLKPFMLPEAVGVPLTPARLGAPDDYTDRREYIRRWEERRRAARPPRWQEKADGKMES